MQIILISLIMLFAAAVGTMAGFGISTIMIPVLLMFFPPIETIFLAAIIHFFGNLWRVALFHRGFNFKIVALFGISGLITGFAGASVSVNLNTELLSRVLGGFFIAYAIFIIFKLRFKIKPVNSMAVAGGVLYLDFLPVHLVLAEESRRCFYRHLICQRRNISQHQELSDS